MKNIFDLLGFQVVDLNLDKETGHLEIELLDDSGGTDFLIFEISALYFATRSYEILDETTGRCDIDYLLEPIFSVEHMLPFVKGQVIQSTELLSPEQVSELPEYWNPFNPCIYRNKGHFKQRLTLSFEADSLQLEANEQCEVDLSIDIESSNYEFYK